jgi:hypothetical protein
MYKITTTELLDKLMAQHKTTFVAVRTAKKEKPLKKSRVTGEAFEGSVISESTYSAGLCYDYETAVNNRREREGKEADFHAESLPFGNWYNGSKIIIEHNGKYYVRLTLNANNKPQKHYYLNGKPVEFESIADVMPKPSGYGSDKQELEKQVKVINVALESIKKINMNGETYEVVAL